MYDCNNITEFIELHLKIRCSIKPLENLKIFLKFDKAYENKPMGYKIVTSWSWVGLSFHFYWDDESQELETHSLSHSKSEHYTESFYRNVPF